MSIFRHVIEIYLIALLVLIHSSLLFCNGDNCAMDPTPVKSWIPKNFLSMLLKLLSSVPVSMQTLQVIAHFLILGDIIFVARWMLQTLGNVFRYLITIIILALILCVTIYVVANGGISIQTVQSYVDHLAKNGTVYVQQAY